MLIAQNLFHKFPFASVRNTHVEASIVKFDVMCLKLWSGIDNMFTFMHEHRSGEDQLYLAVLLKFNSKSCLMLWWKAERQVKACLYCGGIQTCICEQWDQYRLCCHYFTSVQLVKLLWQWTMNSTRTYHIPLKMYCWQHYWMLIFNASIWEAFWHCYCHYRTSGRQR